MQAEEPKLKIPQSGQRQNLSADPQKAKEFKRQLEQHYRNAKPGHNNHPGSNG